MCFIAKMLVLSWIVWLLTDLFFLLIVPVMQFLFVSEPWFLLVSNRDGCSDGKSIESCYFKWKGFFNLYESSTVKFSSAFTKLIAWVFCCISFFNGYPVVLLAKYFLETVLFQKAFVTKIRLFQCIFFTLQCVYSEIWFILPLSKVRILMDYYEFVLKVLSLRNLPDWLTFLIYYPAGISLA